jgi:hypothetical protein
MGCVLVVLEQRAIGGVVVEQVDLVDADALEPRNQVEERREAIAAVDEDGRCRYDAAG